MKQVYILGDRGIDDIYTYIHVLFSVHPFSSQNSSTLTSTVKIKTFIEKQRTEPTKNRAQSAEKKIL